MGELKERRRLKGGIHKYQQEIDWSCPVIQNDKEEMLLMMIPPTEVEGNHITEMVIDWGDDDELQVDLTATEKNK